MERLRAVRDVMTQPPSVEHDLVFDKVCRLVAVPNLPIFSKRILQSPEYFHHDVGLETDSLWKVFVWVVLGLRPLFIELLVKLRNVQVGVGCTSRDGSKHDVGIYNVQKATCYPTCIDCNGVVDDWIDANPFGVDVGGKIQQTATAQFHDGTKADLTNSATWKSSNTAVATVSAGLVRGVSAGTLSLSAQEVLVTQSGEVCQNEPPPRCQEGPVQPSSPGCAGELKFSGTANNFIFVGTDPNILSANSYYLALAQNTPTGGIYGGTSSDSKDKITLTWVSSLNLEKATIQTTDQSATVGDRTLTFTYTPPSHPEFTLTQKVTARQFFWVTNNSPGSTCSPGYGWLYNYVYTPYTHPDGVVVPGGGLLTGTATTENFNPTTIACGNQPGPGALNANRQFGDTIELCSTQPIPTCSSTNTQTLSIAGYQVRTNSLTIANTGLTYTSEGPTK
jgi:hypothetical protein